MRNKILLLLTIATLLPQAAFAVGKIQKQGVKTLTDCTNAGATGATCLIDDSQLWVNSLSEQLSSAITNGDLGGSKITENAQSGTTYTFTTSDAGKLVSSNNSSSVTITVPSNANAAIPVGTQIKVFNLGTGNVTMSPDTGVTIDSKNGYVTLGGQYNLVNLFKSATNLWYMWGDLAASFISATGGSVTTDGNFKVHTFTTSGTFTINSGSGSVDTLIIGGGGATGPGNADGGGGAGEFKYTTGTSMSAGSFPVTVGAGGVGGATPTDGGSSSFNGLTATGGGKGATAGVAAGNGGSGGGASTGQTTPGTGAHGHAGGTANASVLDTGGGGGGAGTVGGNANTSSGGAGGNGTANSITGSSVTYAGGGGGCNGETTSPAAPGGTGGGGSGRTSSISATAGTNGLGGGAGCGSANGGSGVVIIRYQFQ